MKISKLNLHHENNWILESGTDSRYSYKVRNKNFDILYERQRLYFGIKIDGGSEILIPPSGNYSDDKVELFTTAKIFDPHDYMQVTHTIRNKKQTILQIDIGLNLDIKIFNGKVCDVCDYKNISGTKGVSIYNELRNFSFIFRGSSYATDVDNLAVVYNNASRFWPNSYSAGQKLDYLAFSWEDRNILAGETQRFSYVVGNGDYHWLLNKGNSKNKNILISLISKFSFVLLSSTTTVQPPTSVFIS